MASEVDVCNLALAHLGDEATVSSINPPEGSVQAAHCARFYPIARDALLEMHNWGFATRRAQLAQLVNDRAEWLFAYALPSSTLRALSVLPPGATDELVASGVYAPQKYTIAASPSGKVLYTNQENAILLYTTAALDITQFSPLFITTVSWYLASMLAGPVLKGDVGAAEAKRCVQMMGVHLKQAKESDANQRNVRPTAAVPWMVGR